MQGKLFILFTCLLVIAILIPTHQFFTQFFSEFFFKSFPVLRLDTFILFFVGFIGLCAVYFVGIIERHKLKKQLKLITHQNMMRISSGDENKESS